MRRVFKIAGWGLFAAALVATPVVGNKLGRPDGPTPAETLVSSPVPDGRVSARFFGTTTLSFGDGRNMVMIDGFFTRPGLIEMSTRPVPSNLERIAKALGDAKIATLDLLLVSHSHLDHALDAAVVAQRTGALLAGSDSTRQIGLGGGLPESRIRVVKQDDVLTAGEFSVRVIQSLHSRDDSFPGAIAAPLAQPAKVDAYRNGGTYAFLIGHKGLDLLVHPSANYVPGMYRGVRADVVFLATGGLGRQDDAFAAAYWDEIVKATGAKLVIPIHWDDFLRPLDEPMLPMRRMMDDHEKAMARIRPLAARDGVKIRFMPVITAVDIGAAVN